MRKNTVIKELRAGQQGSQHHLQFPSLVIPYTP